MKRILLFFTFSMFSLASTIAAGDKGELRFMEHADECLTIMSEAAKGMSIQGVAVVAYIPGEKSSKWTSKMTVVGALSNDKANYLAIAYSKAAEMAETLKNSSTALRKPLFGEFGYKGGMIQKVKNGYILTVFSGATGEQDAEVATKGLEWLAKKF
jgi:uncharacterized protein GlcG (DUF336 family)